MPGRKTCLALALLLFLAASPNVPAQNDRDVSENVSLDNETASKVSFMFVQEASNGTFVKGSDGNYTLTLQSVVPYTIYFSDRPEQIAGFAPMERFIAGYNWRSPNAALSLVDADENEDTVILSITKPRYDNVTGTLIYTAKILEDPVNERFSYLTSRADAGIPERFGRSALFIDDCSDAYVECGKDGPHFFCDICGTVSCGCCWHVGYLLCQPCGSNSHYEKKCQKEHGKDCSVTCDQSCRY